MSDNREELLRSQAMLRVMDAMGMAQVHTHGNDSMAGGVYLDNESAVRSRTYWTDRDGTRYVYDVRVGVEVTRTVVTRDGR